MKKIFSVFTMLLCSSQIANAATVVGTLNGNPITYADITALTELIEKKGVYYSLYTGKFEFE